VDNKRLLSRQYHNQANGMNVHVRVSYYTTIRRSKWCREWPGILQSINQSKFL